MRDGSKPTPGGWTRIQAPGDDIEREVARPREAGQTFRNDIVKGVGGSWALIDGVPARGGGRGPATCGPNLSGRHG